MRKTLVDKPDIPSSYHEEGTLAEAFNIAKLTRLRRDFGDDFWSLDKAELSSTGRYVSHYTATPGWLKQLLVAIGVHMDRMSEEMFRHLLLEIKELVLSNIKCKHLLLVRESFIDASNEVHNTIVLLQLHEKYNMDGGEPYAQLRLGIVSSRNASLDQDFKPLTLAPWTLHALGRGKNFVFFGNDGKSKESNGDERNVIQAYLNGTLGCALVRTAIHY